MRREGQVVVEGGLDGGPVYQTQAEMKEDRVSAERARGQGPLGEPQRVK